MGSTGSLPHRGARRDTALDALRGFAALAVVFTHLVTGLGLLPYEPLGSVGVLVFFALSGYLITGHCLRSPATPEAYRAFLRRRLVRLGPVALGLATVGTAALLAPGNVPTARVLRDSLAALAQVTAFTTAAGVDTLPPLLPTWSLTVEWVFYLAFPVFVFGLMRRGVAPDRLWRVLAATAVSLYLAGLALPPLAFYLLPVATLGVLVAGGALAAWHRSGSRADADPARARMAVVLLVLLVVTPGSVLGLGWRLAVFPVTVLASLVVIHAAASGTAVPRVLRSGLLAGVGVRAYSLYVWHSVVLWVVWSSLGAWSPWGLAALAAAVTAVVVHLSFELLERPALTGGRPRVVAFRGRSMTEPDRRVVRPTRP